MDDFIRAENLKLYRRAPSESSDAEQRRVLLVLLRLLLAEEEAAHREQAVDLPPETNH
jgi:hypothetical protein